MNQNDAILGNSIDVNLCNIEDAEIRADVVVKQINAKRIWGQVVDCEGRPIGNVLVKLVKVTCAGDRMEYHGVAHTVADCMGFYQFDLCADDRACYRIIVSKAVSGGETVINTKGGNCNMTPDSGCSPNNIYDTCREQPVTVLPYEGAACACPNTCVSPNAAGCVVQPPKQSGCTGTNYATYNNY